MIFQGLYEGGHRTGLLADGHIDTIHRLARLIVAFLVDDGVDSHGSLARLAVADDQLALSATNGNHRVDSLQTGLQRLFHRLTIDHAGRLAVERHLKRLGKVNVSLAVDRLAQRVDHTTEEVIVHPDRGDAMRALHRLTLLDAGSRTQEDATHVVFLEVHDNGHSAVLKLEQLVGFGITESVDSGHTVADCQYGTDFVKFLFSIDTFELLKQHLRYLAWFNFI